MAKVSRKACAVYSGVEEGFAVWGSRVMIAVIPVEADAEVAMMIQLL